MWTSWDLTTTTVRSSYDYRQVSGGGPVGLETRWRQRWEDAGTLEDVYEPYLLMNGLLNWTPRGDGDRSSVSASRHVWNHKKRYFEI